MKNITQFTAQDVEILNEQTIYDGFFKLKKIQFKHRLFKGGYSDVVTREMLIKGAAVAVIAYDPNLDSVVIIEQIRIGAYTPQSDKTPWLFELVAGLVEEGESPVQVAIRESKEEAGMAISNLTPVLSFWDSPGGMIERIHLFVAQVDGNQVQGIHGLAQEHEDIRVHLLPRQLAYKWITQGKIDNGVAIIGLQWLELNYQRLQKKWR